ncbi:MAG: DNA (cytosine-5-)-methyltransferase [Ignavibacteria bacterium]|nr:DNA (cytosine-5-)-methyltransferase [Ignavibacteria bacterium]
MAVLNNKFTFIDLFAGAGGLSEGFIRSGFKAVGHVEMDIDACYTLKTRLAYQYLKKINKQEKYFEYLKGNITREQLWTFVPETMFKTVINKKITDKTLNDIFNDIDKLLNGKKVDVIVGGPPCQAYSLIGRSADKKKMKWDRRKFLYRYYAEFLKKYKPKYFVFENVLGLLSAGNRKYLNDMIELFDQCGYKTDLKVLNSEDFGVIQKRRRVIIIGKKEDLNFKFPNIPVIENNWEVKKDLFYDLPVIKEGEILNVAKYKAPINEYLKYSEIRNGIDFVTQNITRIHNKRDLKIYKLAIIKWEKEKKRLKYSELSHELRTHKNISAFLDRYKVVDPYGHSHTMVAHISKDGHYYIYPDENNVRSISVREAARIQSFPDDYYFEGGRTSAFKQIGNAVPPLMAYNIATKLKSSL